MSGKMKVLVIASVFIAGLAVVFMVGPAQGAKPSPPIRLWANFEAENSQDIPCNILNDAEGVLYIDTADTRKVKYGVEVKYYIPGSWDTRGRFKMKVDQAGVLGRFVKLNFKNPITGQYCVTDKAGCGVDGFIGETGEVETRLMEIVTLILLVENADGELEKDESQPIGMDTMKTGDIKYVGLGISFTPDDPDFDYRYDLGHFTDPDNYVPGLTCQAAYYPWGPAEIYCVAAGQEWEFRPCSKAYVNEPNNVWRLLYGEVLLNYWTYCRLQKWEMPFVLRVGKL